MAAEQQMDSGSKSSEQRTDSGSKSSEQITDSVSMADKLQTEASMAEPESYFGNDSLALACESSEECINAGNSLYFYPEGKIYNTESYEKPDENGFFLSRVQPLSTIAADVDTASYTNIRRMIESGYSAAEIPSEAVRPEEFINYFSYDLDSPLAGDKFGVTAEVSACPWNRDHQLMFIGVKAEDPYEGTVPESNLVFLIDVSGSMAHKDKLTLLQDSFKDLVDNLPGEGVVSIVTYASKEEVVLDGVDMREKSAIKKAISSLSASGSTAGERGMQMAYEIAQEHFIDGGNNRIIMATDGDLNVGISDPDELEKFIEKKKESGIFLSVLGFGEGNYKDDRLERLADCGNGNYSYIDSKLEGHKVLVEEMSSTLVTVAKDVKFQVEFNPARVNAYRLIGYEDRKLEAVDFNDDTKDGGEIGTGHSVVALYEIISADSEAAIDLKYQENTKADESDDFATVKIRYKEPDSESSELIEAVVGNDSFHEKPGDNLAFAELAAGFAMLLSDSEYTGTLSYNDILREFRKIERKDEYRDEFYNLVRMVEKRN
ncbi:MAG: VWA domain-containing protein [Butyrivibrio sp.]|nr:VWA domain-containing protein [Butyrivibrio sp.]